MARVVLLVWIGVGVGCYSGAAVMTRYLVLLLLLFSSSAFSQSAIYYQGQLSGNYGGSAVFKNQTCSAVIQSIISAYNANNNKSYTMCVSQQCPTGNIRLNNATQDCISSISSYVTQSTCPANTYLNNSTQTCVPTCASQGLVYNSYTTQCQTACPVDPPSSNSIPGVSVQTGLANVCTAGCVDVYSTYSGIDLSGFTVHETTHGRNGAMCGAGDAIPTTPPRNCPPPSVVRADNTCGTPDPVCKSWEMLENHACVDKPCPVGKILKCGMVNGVQECLCSGKQDCNPGSVKDAFGNCIPNIDCPSGQTRNPITLKCGAPPDPSCPTNTHREGLICVADPSTPGEPDPPKTGPNSGDLDGDGESNSNDDDSDGDGKKNGSDNDADNDGTPNSSDSTPLGPGSEGAKLPDGDFDGDGILNKTDLDRDGDGEPNSTDTTPDGPGSKPDTDPNGDNDGDGIPNNKDADADLDGDTIPNYLDTDRDGDGIPNAQDSSPDGPGTTEDPKKYDPSKDLDGDGIPNANDNDRDGDGIPNASDSTPDGPGSKPGADTDLDGDGIPNGQDGDIDGDGIPNGDDKYPYGGGTGDGTAEEQKKESTTPAGLDGFDLYQSREKRFSDVWSSFTGTIQSAPIALAGSNFFRLSSLSGACQTYSATVPFIDAQVSIDAQCSSEVADGLRIAGIIVLIIAAWVAFRIALL